MCWERKNVNALPTESCGSFALAHFSLKVGMFNLTFKAYIWISLLREEKKYAREACQTGPERVINEWKHPQPPQNPKKSMMKDLAITPHEW